MKKAVVCALLAAMLVGNTASVKAADLREIFDAKYYAEQYPDLKQAFGDDEEALYQHFLTYGLKEGRNMNPVLNVQAYRAKYADLDAAFGDNWEAYVQHFFTYGIRENRDNGTDFDINAYLENYADLKEAFGTDYMAAAKHYMIYGIHENRQEASKEFVWAREEAGKTADEDQSDETEKIEDKVESDETGKPEDEGKFDEVGKDDNKDNSDEAGKDDDKDNSDEVGKDDDKDNSDEVGKDDDKDNSDEAGKDDDKDNSDEAGKGDDKDNSDEVGKDDDKDNSDEAGKDDDKDNSDEAGKGDDKDNSDETGKDEDKDNSEEAGKDDEDNSDEVGKDDDKDNSDETGKDEDKDNSDEAGKDDDKDNSDEVGKDEDEDNSDEAGKDDDKDNSDEIGKDDDKDNSDEAGKDDDKDNSDDTGKSDFVIDLGSINTFGVNTERRTAEQIISYLSSSNAKIENDTNVTGYDLSAPYAAGTVSEEDLQEALDMLNQVRYIAGLDTDVTLNSEYTKKIQTGVLINAVNKKMEHRPTQPEGMSEEMYKFGYAGTSFANLAWSSGKMTLSESILGWLDDSDKDNISTLGHRRWVLNPSMKQTGFGYIYDGDVYDGNVGTYSGMYAFDGAFGETDKNGVAWPAREMPMQYFKNSTAWSYSYGQDLGDVTVKLQCLNTDKAKEWNFSSDASDGFFNVENSYYGQTGCVIFRPEGIAIEAGDVYLVTITNNGSELANYTVRFFE